MHKRVQYIIYLESFTRKRNENYIIIYTYIYIIYCTNIDINIDICRRNLDETLIHIHPTKVGGSYCAFH